MFLLHACWSLFLYLYIYIGIAYKGSHYFHMAKPGVLNILLHCCVTKWNVNLYYILHRHILVIVHVHNNYYVSYLCVCRI